MRVAISTPTVTLSGENLCTITAEVAVLADDGSTLETTPISRTVGAGDVDAVASVSDAIAAHAYERYRQQQIAAEFAKQAAEMKDQAQAKAEVHVAAYNKAHLVAVAIADKEILR